MKHGRIKITHQAGAKIILFNIEDSNELKMFVIKLHNLFRDTDSSCHHVVETQL